MSTPQTGPALPPAGWYPDPGQPGLARWWDGVQWSGHAQPASLLTPAARPAVAPRPPLGPGWRKLAIALQVVLATSAAVGLVSGAVSIWASRVIHGWSEDPTTVEIGTGEAIDNAGITVTVAQLLLLLAGAVLMITWLYRAHRSDRMNPAFLKHGSGWAIGGWFTPILSLWRPYQMVREVEGAASTGLHRSPLVGLWWATWLLSTVAASVAAAMMPDEEASSLDDVADIADAFAVDAVAQGLTAVAAGLAVLVVRHVTRRVLSAPAV